MNSTTAVNCVDGHCWHEGTAVGTFYCCKCSQYWRPRVVGVPNYTYSGNPYEEG